MITPSSGSGGRGRRFRWLIVILLVLAIVLLVAFSLAQIHPVQAYLVAARPLSAGTILTSDDVTTSDLDPNNIPSSAVLADNINSILGQQVVLPFAAGDIITSTHLGNASGDVAAGVPKDMRVFKFVTKDVPMPDGLQAGDKIDVMLAIHQASGVVEIIYEIQGLVIHAIAPDNSSITLWVPPGVAEMMVLAQQGGQVVILAAPSDEQFLVLPPVTSTQPCQIFINPNGEVGPPPLGATACPTPTGGGQPNPSPTVQPSPSATSTPQRRG